MHGVSFSVERATGALLDPINVHIWGNTHIHTIVVMCRILCSFSVCVSHIKDESPNLPTCTND